MFEMEEIIHEEDFLSLSLALVTNSCYQNKIKSSETPNTSSDNSSVLETSDQENNIFSLLQMREQMLKHINTKHLPTNHHHHNQEESIKGLHLIHLLLMSATSLDSNNFTSVTESLFELYQNVSLTGDSVQRVAAYFADGLVARLLTRKSPFYETIMKRPTKEEEFFSFTEIYKASPFYQFAHFTANQAILEAFEKEQNSNNGVLHIIDFDISYGFQWPSLMQSLSENASSTNKILLKITGFGRNLEQLLETESRLVSFSKGFKNLVFEFHGIVKSSSSLTKPKIRKNETVAVNLIFYLNSLNSYYRISEILRFVYSLNPSIVVLVEQEGSRNTHNFLSRFMESLHYFAAIFDSLDDCLPLDSAERLSIEKNHFGREIKHVVNCDETYPRFEKMEKWRGRMEGHGFCGVGQSSYSVMQAKLLLKIRSSNCSASVNFDGESTVSGGFNVFERDDGMAISLGWQDRFLITASSWCCV